MELGPRDRLSQAFVHEVEKGRTIDSPYGPIVHLDLRHLGAKLIDTKLPFVRELCLKYERIDPVTELIPVRPVVHYMMGGVHTDIDGATPLAGLYAAGETACVSINGANRLGSNSLPECLVFGARAGRAAAEYAADAPAAPPAVDRGPGRRRGAPPRAAARHRDAGAETRRGRSATRCRRRWRTPPGIYRTGPAMAKGVDTLARAAGARRRSVGIWDTSRTFNTELVAALELANMLDIAECISPRACSARSPAARTSAPTSPHATTSGSSPTTWSHRDADGTPRVERAAGDDHPLASGRAGLREVADGRARITPAA